MKEKIAWLVLYIVAILIGVGMFMVVINAVKQAKIEACFDYKDPKVCEEVINEIKK